MSDQQPDNLYEPPLPGGTQAAAANASARASGSWRAKILDRLATCPSAIFELADHFGVTDNRISGRCTGLAKDGYIEPSGEKRLNPATGCPAEVLRLRRAAGNDPSPVEQLVNRSYPLTLRIDNDLFDRQALVRAEAYAGVPYSRRADTGGLRRSVRVELFDCPACGAAMAFAESAPDGSRKRFRCLRDGHTWLVRTVSEPGRSPLLALVMEEIS